MTLLPNVALKITKNGEQLPKIKNYLLPPAPSPPLPSSPVTALLLCSPPPTSRRWPPPPAKLFRPHFFDKRTVLLIWICYTNRLLHKLLHWYKLLHKCTTSVYNTRKDNFILSFEKIVKACKTRAQNQCE